MSGEISVQGLGQAEGEERRMKGRRAADGVQQESGFVLPSQGGANDLDLDCKSLKAQIYFTRSQWPHLSLTCVSGILKHLAQCWCLVNIYCTLRGFQEQRTGGLAFTLRAKWEKVLKVIRNAANNFQSQMCRCGTEHEQSRK